MSTEGLHNSFDGLLVRGIVRHSSSRLIGVDTITQAKADTNWRARHDFVIPICNRYTQ